MESQEWPASVFPYRPIVENPAPETGTFFSWNLESRTFFPMESKMLGFGLRNTTLGIRRPLTIGIRNPRVLNLESKTVIPLHGRPLHNQEKKLWKLMKWSPKGKCFAIFHGNISQPNPVQIGLVNVCVWILGLKGLGLRVCLHHGLSRKCSCYRQLYWWPRVKQ